MEYLEVKTLEQIEKEEKEEKEAQEEKSLKKGRSYICYLLSKHWCKIFAIVIISIVYCIAEIIKEIIEKRPQKINNFIDYLCKHQNISKEICE